MPRGAAVEIRNSKEVQISPGVGQRQFARKTGLPLGDARQRKMAERQALSAPEEYDHRGDGCRFLIEIFSPHDIAAQLA